LIVWSVNLVRSVKCDLASVFG